MLYTSKAVPPIINLSFSVTPGALASKSQNCDINNNINIALKDIVAYNGIIKTD